MTAYFDKLERFIRENGVQCEHLRFPQSCHSVAEAAAAVGAEATDFIKSVCLRSPADELIVAIVKGEDRASRAHVAQALGFPKVQVASPDFMLRHSGYPAGGTPAFGYAATFLMDERVMEKEFVYSGGGSVDALVKMSPAEILKWNHARIARIRE